MKISFLTSDDFLDLEHLPKRLVFVGGGYVAFEFAHLAARAGSRVTILHRGNRPLENFDPTLVDVLLRHTRKAGIDVRLETAVNRIERLAEGFAVHSGSGLRIEADSVIHAAGRVPNVERLELGAGGVKASPRGVEVNEYLQSRSNPYVYAVGDCAASGPPLTSIASYERAESSRAISYTGTEKKHATIVVLLWCSRFPLLRPLGSRRSRPVRRVWTSRFVTVNHQAGTPHGVLLKSVQATKRLWSARQNDYWELIFWVKGPKK